MRIEQSFGIVKMKFPCSRQLLVKPVGAIEVVLHNNTNTFLQKDIMHLNKGVAIEDDFEHVGNKMMGLQ